MVELVEGFEREPLYFDFVVLSSCGFVGECGGCGVGVGGWLDGFGGRVGRDVGVWWWILVVGLGGSGWWVWVGRHVGVCWVGDAMDVWLGVGFVSRYG